MTDGDLPGSDEDAVDRLGRAAGAELRRAPSDEELGRVAASGRRQRVLRAVAVGGVVAAVAASITVGVVRSRDRDETVTTGTTPATSAAPTVPVAIDPPTPTVEVTTAATSAPATQEPALVGRRWIRLPTDDQDRYENELEFEVSDLGHASGFDGCDTWTSDLSIEQASDPASSSEQVFAIRFDPPPVAGSCASRQQSLVEGQVVVSPDGHLRLLDGGGQTEATYVAADALTTPAGDDLVSAWLTPSGSRLELLGEGTARLGACAPVGTWSYSDGVLSLSGFDAAPAETAACAGGQVSGIIRSLTPALAEGPVQAVLAAEGPSLLVRVGDRRFWLQPAGPVSALDLESSTVYGFGTFSDVSADFVVDTVSGVAGPPTFDSGWRVIPPVDETDYAECYGGLGQRVVFWGDVWFSFLRGDFPQQDRLHVVGAGAVESGTIPRYDGPLPDQPAEPSVSLQGVGPGSTVDALAAAGFPIGDGYIDGGVRMATVSVNDDIVTGIYYENPGFC